MSLNKFCFVEIYSDVNFETSYNAIKLNQTLSIRSFGCFKEQTNQHQDDDEEGCPITLKCISYFGVLCEDLLASVLLVYQPFTLAF